MIIKLLCLGVGASIGWIARWYVGIMEEEERLHEQREQCCKTCGDLIEEEERLRERAE